MVKESAKQSGPNAQEVVKRAKRQAKLGRSPPKCKQLRALRDQKHSTDRLVREKGEGAWKAGLHMQRRSAPNPATHSAPPREYAKAAKERSSSRPGATNVASPPSTSSQQVHDQGRVTSTRREQQCKTPACASKVRAEVWACHAGENLLL